MFVKKMWSKVSLFVYLLHILAVDCNLAPYIKKCKIEDSKCILDSTHTMIPIFVEGIPNHKVEKLEPIILNEVDSSTTNIKFIVTNVTVVGVKQCEAKKTSVEKSTMKLTVNILCPNVLIDGNYDMKGKLFVLPIEGNGDLHVVLRKLLIKVEVDLVTKNGKDGKPHWSIKRWTHTFELKDKSDVKFDNLFPDNALLRKTTADFIASNGNDVITEVGPPIIKAVTAKVVDNVSKFWKSVPLEDLVLDS